MSNLFLEQNCTFFGQDFCPSDGQKTFPKHVAFYSKNKFEKLVHLAGFIIRKYHNARSSECQNVGWSMEGIDLAHDKGRWQAFVNAERSTGFPQNVESFLTC